jgi:predicted DNA binding CopG/RHH family protein
MQCNDTIRVRVPEHLAGAVKSAAAASYLSASAYIRQAVADRLKRDGFNDGR